MRVVCLLPSATEIVVGLAGESALDGTGETGAVQLVGRSHECDWPRGVGLERVPVLTGAKTAFTSAAEVDQAVRSHLEAGSSLYTLDVERLKGLKPDVIITQDLCAVCSIDLEAVRRVAERMDPRRRVISLNPETFEGILDDIGTVGEAIGLGRRATEWVVELRERAYRAEEYVNPYVEPPSVAFLEWTDPLYVGGHWTPQMIERAGGAHPLNPTRAVGDVGAAAGPIGQTMRRAGKSIRVSEEELVRSRPEFVVVCPCGLDVDAAWRETELLARKAWWRELPAVQRGRVAVVDGNQMFSRPGPRVVEGLEFLVGWLNERPEVIPAGFPWRAWPA